MSLPCLQLLPVINTPTSLRRTRTVFVCRFWLGSDRRPIVVSYCTAVSAAVGFDAQSHFVDPQASVLVIFVCYLADPQVISLCIILQGGNPQWSLSRTQPSKWTPRNRQPSPSTTLSALMARRKIFLKVRNR